MSEAEEFDWGDLGEEFWRSAAGRVRRPGLKRPTEEQIKFACSLHRGLSKSAAAEAAGYTGDHESMRNRGHAAASTTGVTALLEEAAIEAPADEGIITRDGRKRVLSKIVKRGSHSDRIRANDSLEKIELSERAERGKQPDADPAETARLIICACPALHGPAIAVGAWYEAHHQIENFPYIAQVAPLLAQKLPTDWARWRGDRPNPELDAAAAGPVLSPDELVAVLGTSAFKHELRAPRPNGFAHAADEAEVEQDATAAA